MIDSQLPEDMVKAFEVLLKAGMITEVDVIKKVYALGYRHGYQVPQFKKDEHSRNCAMAYQGA